MEKNKCRFVKVSVLILIVIGVLVWGKVYYINSNLKYSQEYIIGEGNIKGSVDKDYFSSRGEEFEIGANKDGYAVFKNPKEAFEKIKNDYKNGIAIIQKEFNLLPISKSNYEIYGIYGWQVTTGSEAEKKQAAFISSFMDIYENSFNEQ